MMRSKVEQVSCLDSDDNEVDDKDIPLGTVIHDALGLGGAKIPAYVDQAVHCVENADADPDNALEAAGEHEDIWALISFDALL